VSLAKWRTSISFEVKNDLANRHTWRCSGHWPSRDRLGVGDDVEVSEAIPVKLRTALKVANSERLYRVSTVDNAIARLKKAIRRGILQGFLVEYTK